MRVGSIPAGSRAAVRELAARLGLSVRVATVAGDDLIAPWDTLVGRRTAGRRRGAAGSTAWRPPKRERCR